MSAFLDPPRPFTYIDYAELEKRVLAVWGEENLDPEPYPPLDFSDLPDDPLFDPEIDYSTDDPAAEIEPPLPSQSSGTALKVLRLESRGKTFSHQYLRPRGKNAKRITLRRHRRGHFEFLAFDWRQPPQPFF